MTTYPQYKRALTDPMPRRAEAYRLYGPGGQHSSPLPRERRQPTQVACWHCGHLATSSPCQSCIGQQPPPPPPPKEPATIEMGPLPTDLAIDDHACADLTNTDQHCDPEPLPVAWATFQPDMSCYAVDPATMTAGDISHPALMRAISQGTYSITREYWRSEYQGRLDATTQRSIMDYMRERGGTGGLHNCRIISGTMDLSITCMGERTTIELVDYGTPNTMPAYAAAPAVEIGGAAW